MNYRAESEKIIENSIVVRGHADIYEMIQRRENGEKNPIYDSWYPRLAEANTDIVVLAVSGDSLAHRNGDMRYLHSTLKHIDYVLSEIEKNPKLEIIKTSQDIPKKSSDKLYFLLSLEGGLPLEGNINILHQFYRLGIRLLQPTHNLRNELADGVNDKETKGSLSKFGMKVIEELNRLGIIIDLAHISEAGFWQALEVSKDPVIVSHANCKAICNNKRNLTDEQIKAINKQDGIVGALYFPGYLCEGPPNHESLIKHINHLRNIVSHKNITIGHLGFDRSLVETFSNVNAGPYLNYHLTTQKFNGGYNEKEQYIEFVQNLLKNDFTNNEIEDILGKNFIRIIDEVL